MVKLDCIILKKYKEKLIKELHKTGTTEVEFFNDSYLEKIKIIRDKPSDRMTEVSSLLLKVRKAIDSLEVFHNKRKSFIEGLLNAERVKKIKTENFSNYEKLKEYSENILSEVGENIEELEKRINETEVMKSEISEKINKFKKIKNLDIKLNYIGTSIYLYITAGIISKSNIYPLEKELTNEFKNKDFAVIKGKRNGDSEFAIAVVTRKENSEKLKRILGRQDYEAIHMGEEEKEYSKGIRTRLKELEISLNSVKREKENTTENLKEIYEKRYMNLIALEELLKIEKERLDIFHSFGRTEKTIMMRFFVPKVNAAEVMKLIKKETKDKCLIEINKKPENAPILLQNKGIVKRFEVITKLFALPRYKEIDPTLFLIPTFCMFFGIMLTDAIYGMILILASILIVKKYGNYSENAKDAATILTGAGLMAIVFGMLTGSYLGDFLGRYVLGKNPQSISLWLDPMFNGTFNFLGWEIPNAMMFLIFVCFLGLLHLYAGYFLGAYDALRKGEIKEAITKYMSWYILLFGIFFIVFSGMMNNPLITEYGPIAGGIISILGLVLLYIGVGFLIFLDLIGLVGNILSYARLLAMSLTTAGIAMSFNFLSSMSLSVPYVGVIIAIVVFIFGHVINILINSLGAFVHSLRLHYVEHFGTFYSGGGKPFKPFREERKYTSY